MNYGELHDPVRLDDYGTVRVSEQLRTVAIYVKTGDNCWRATYIDPKSGESVFPTWNVSDAVAGFGAVVYAPKSVE